jgi:hypothetical protein
MKKFDSFLCILVGEISSLLEKFLNSRVEGGGGHGPPSPNEAPQMFLRLFMIAETMLSIARPILGVSSAKLSSLLKR